MRQLFTQKVNYTIQYKFVFSRYTAVDEPTNIHLVFRNNIKRHEQDCPYRLVDCPFCAHSCRNHEENGHICDRRVSLTNLKNHIKDVHKIPETEMPQNGKFSFSPLIYEENFDEIRGYVYLQDY